MIARNLVVHGQVQGVFFRASTRDRAQAEGLVGWVRNRPDGAVEMHLQGAPDAVARVEDWVRSGGPRGARVERVESADVDRLQATTFAVTR